MFTFYEVGGKVRDELMGLQSKDHDFVAVPHNEYIVANYSAGVLFNLLHRQLFDLGYEIFLVTKECFTIRAKFPKYHKNAGIVADFVMARKEKGYLPGTRTPIVVPGTLYDDLERRDFTVNAIAKSENGELIDPFRGQDDIKNKTLRTPLDVYITLADDPLRILRAIRFSITKDFRMTGELWDAIRVFDYPNKMKVVSEERIREELFKAFKADTLRTMATLCDFPKLARYVFDDTNLWLKPTNEAK